MLVYKDGKIIYEKNLGLYNKTTIEPIASCSKWLTAALVMTFVDEGRLSLNDTIGKFLPIYSKYHKGYIKLWNCLSHTTGIESEKFSFASVVKRRELNSLADEVDEFAAKNQVAKPGEQFFYSNTGLNIAGRILEVVSGKNFETLFQQRIAVPLGMKNTSFKSPLPANPSGGAKSSAEDYLNFLVMILNKGEFNGKRILTPHTISLMQKNYTQKAQTLYSPEQAIGLHYGLGEWIFETDQLNNTTMVASPGLFGTFPVVNIKNNYAAILLVKNLKSSTRRETDTQIIAAIDEALGH